MAHDPSPGLMVSSVYMFLIIGKHIVMRVSCKHAIGQEPITPRIQSLGVRSETWRAIAASKMPHLVELLEIPI
jgi:hypothetical protein